jgi:pentatricopeptide repeat protein
MVLAVFASHVVWTDPSQQIPPAVSLTLQPLLRITRGIMAHIQRTRYLLLADRLLKEFPKLHQYLQAVLDGASPSSHNALPGAHGPQPSVPRSKTQFSHLRSRLDDALKMKKAVTPAALWTDFKAARMHIHGLAEPDLKDCKSLLDRFGMVFMAFQQPDKSVEVWNAMRETNLEALQPDVRTFTAGIEGCKWARNLSGINELWKRLIESGLSLDTYTWTERISGLIACGDVDAGLEALNDLGDMWTYQRDRDKPWYIPPSIEPVNAALAGLLRARGLKDAQTLLAWAAERGVNPDIFTYNLLLRPMLAAKMTDKVNRIFDMMKQQGVTANPATLTILLEGTLANYASQSEAEQGEVVNTIFEKLKIVGLEANSVTMGKMIHTLLKARKRSDVAVKAVLAYMWDKGIELTPHISSMLVTHYFDFDPPDLNAIETLIRNRHLRDKQGIDHVFWEDIARGYARLNMTEPALKAFEKLESADAPVTLRTHEQLLSSIIRQPESVDRSTAMRIVEMAIRHAERRVGVVEAGKMDQRYMRHHFWQLAKEHGLLGQEEVDRLTAALKRPIT